MEVGKRVIDFYCGLCFLFWVCIHSSPSLLFGLVFFFVFLFVSFSSAYILKIRCNFYFLCGAQIL